MRSPSRHLGEGASGRRGFATVTRSPAHHSTVTLQTAGMPPSIRNLGEEYFPPTTLNLRDVSRLGEWRKQLSERVVQLDAKMPWQRAIIETDPIDENKKNS